MSVMSVTTLTSLGVLPWHVEVGMESRLLLVLQPARHWTAWEKKEEEKNKKEEGWRSRRRRRRGKRRRRIK